MRKKSEPKIEEIKFSLDKLDYLLRELAEAGATEKDYKDIGFGLDFTGCYYESDSPRFVAVWYKKI